MRDMRHIVTIYRPTEATEGHGALQGTPLTLFRDVPCSIEPLTAREAEVARQLSPQVTHKVKLYGDPNKPLKALDYLVDHKGAKLEIAGVLDLKRNGCELELTCAEVPNG